MKANTNTWRWWRCGSMHEEVYWRSRMGTAFRTGWACLMAGVILQVGSMHVQWVTFPIFGYVMAVTVVGESTASKAMQDALAVATGTAQGVGINLVVLQLMPPARSFTNVGVAIACIAITSFFATLPKATPTTNILHKRIMLAHSAIIYISALVQREHMDQIFFPLRLAATTIVGATCGMLAILLPYPRLAIFQIHSQTKLAARITSEQLKVLTDAFSATDTARASAFYLQAKALAKIASSVHSEIKSIEDHMGCEMRPFPCRSSHKLQNVTRGLSSVQKTLVGLELALQVDLASSAGPSKQRRLLGCIMRDSLVYVTDWVILALKHASTDIMQHSPASHAHRQVIIEEGNEVLSSFHEALSTTRQQIGCALATEEFQHNADNMDNTLGEVSSQSTGDTDEENHDIHMYGHTPHHNDADHDSNFSCSDSEMVETMCNAAKEQLEHRIETGDIGKEDASAILGEIPHSFHSVHGGCLHATVIDHMQESSCDDLQLGSSLLPHTIGALLSFGDQAAASFFLFNVTKFVQETRQILESSEWRRPVPEALEQSKSFQAKVIGTPSGTHNPQLQPVSHIKVLISNPDCHHYLPTSDIDPQLTVSHNRPPPQELSSVQDVPISQNRPVRKSCRKCAASSSLSSKQSNVIGENKRVNIKYLLAGFKSVKPNLEQLRTAFKMSLAMAIGALLGFWFNNKKGYWADITLALGFTGAAKGGSFKVAVLRTLGTVSGSIYGLIVVLATINFPVLRLVALIPWVVLTSFLRQSKIFGYAGAVSAFTGAIVILARTNKDSTDQEFTVTRIVEAFLGMASFLIVEMLVLPRRAASMVKPNIIFGLGKLQEFVSDVFQAYSTEHCDVCRGSKAIEELKCKEEKLRKVLLHQNELVKEAAEEPQFWFAPFPQKIFSKVMEEQGKILEMLHFSLTVFEEITQVTEEARIPIDRLLQAPLKEALTIMEAKVVPTLAFLARMLAVKTQQVVPVHGASHSFCVSNLASTAKSSIDQDRKFVELQSLMMSESPARNSSVFKPYQFMDGATLQERQFISAFERGVLHVAYELAVLEASVTTSPASCSYQVTQASSATSPPPCFDTLSNTLFLSLGTLAFAMNGLLHHTTQLEKVVHELLQDENPWNLIDFWDASKPMGQWPKHSPTPSSCKFSPSSS